MLNFFMLFKSLFYKLLGVVFEGFSSFSSLSRILRESSSIFEKAQQKS
jgi:hypothetical protein